MAEFVATAAATTTMGASTAAASAAASAASSSAAEEAAVCSSHLLSILLTIMEYTKHYGSLYGSKILLLVILSAMAAYRREMSCNRVFHDMDGAAERRGSVSVRSDSATNIEDEEKSLDNNNRRREKREKMGEDEIDALLDGAAHFSGPLSGPLLAVGVAIWGYVAMLKIWGGPPISTAAEKGDAQNEAGGGGWEFVDSATTDGSSSSEYSSSAYAGSGNYSRPASQAVQSDSRDNVAAELRAVPSSLPLLYLPPDTTVHILSYLYPRDVTTFACVSRSTRFLIDDESSVNHEHQYQQHEQNTSSSSRSCSHSVSVLLWKALWWRDYGHVLSQWDVGRMALQRSVRDGSATTDGTNLSSKRLHPAFRHLESSLADVDIVDYIGSKHDTPDDVVDNRKHHHPGDNDADDFLPASARCRSTMKDLYFTFAACWIDYALAGKNTLQRCLVGLHGHVFDISHFVENHPGSPETLLVQSGRDSTAFFEDLGHSLGARRIALGMCAVMDRSCVESLRNVPTTAVAAASSRQPACGLYLPGGGNGIVPERSDVAASRALAAKASGSIPMSRSTPRRTGCLKRIRDDLNKGKLVAQRCADKWAASVGHGTSLENGMLGSVRVYWDPLRGEWLAWYTRMDFHPEFLESDATRFGAK